VRCTKYIYKHNITNTASPKGVWTFLGKSQLKMSKITCIEQQNIKVASANK